LGQAAALYCRVSTADQTCARQESDLRAFAKKAGYKVVGVWKETASGAKDERTESKIVLALAQARKIDIILVTELTRWGRVRSGIAAARERGVVFGRRPGQRIKADRFAPKVLKLVGEGQSYREISHRLGLSKNTVLDIVKWDRLKMPALSPLVAHEIKPTGRARHANLPISEPTPKGRLRRGP
jgi:putative DNA-invertase from lambdoid prophage Rac